MTNIATNTPYLRLDLKTSRIESNQTRKTQTIWECTTETKNKAKTKTKKNKTKKQQQQQQQQKEQRDIMRNKQV